MKKLIYLGVAVGGGFVGAYLFMQYKKKKGGCGCTDKGASATTMPPPATTTPIAQPATTETTQQQVAVGEFVPADGGGFVKQPKTW